jgi:hypothetical protein
LKDIFVRRVRAEDAIESKLLISLNFLVQISTLLFPAVEEELVRVLLRVEHQHSLVNNLDNISEIAKEVK